MTNKFVVELYVSDQLLLQETESAIAIAQANAAEIIEDRMRKRVEFLATAEQQLRLPE